MTVNAGLVDSNTFKSSDCSKIDEAKEATSVSDFNTEGEVMMIHSSCSSSLSGTKAIWSVSGSFAGSDSEHVDEAMSGWVSIGCCEVQMRSLVLVCFGVVDVNYCLDIRVCSVVAFACTVVYVRVVALKPSQLRCPCSTDVDVPCEKTG